MKPDIQVVVEGLLIGIGSTCIGLHFGSVLLGFGVFVLALGVYDRGYKT